MTTLETDRLCELIAKRHECLQQLRDLGHRQVELVEGGDMTQLLKVLAAKQHLIGILHHIEKGLRPFRDEDPEQRRWRSPTDRHHCAQRASECQQLLDEIVKQEKQSEVRMKQRRDEVAFQLQYAHTAANARGSYHADNPSQTRTLDLTSDS